MHVLVKFVHGLGDRAQLSCVLQHLREHRPDWEVDVATQIGKHTGFDGLCRRSLILGRDRIDESQYRRVFDLGWYECYGVYTDSPCTKVCNCLREVFGIVPDLALLKYRIETTAEARQKTRDYLSTICDSPGQGERFPVVAVHYQANTSSHKKDLPHELVAELCREILQYGYVPLILDWDRRSPLPDQKTIFCPGVGPGDLWDNIGTGDAERLAALLAQCALVIGVDSGPLHVAGSTETPTLGVWKGHSPLQFYDLCPNVTHLVPEQWRSIPPCQHDHAAQFFSEHYAYRTYEPDILKPTLIETALEMLAFSRETQPSAIFPAGETSILNTQKIRAPPQRSVVGNGRVGQATIISRANSSIQHHQTSSKEENRMTTAASLTWQQLPGLAHEIALGVDGSAWCLGLGDMSDVGPGGGYSIHRWNGADWDHVDGAADKIAAHPDGSLWVVNREHRGLRCSAAGWELLPGLAREIAVGADGSAWCLSASDFAPGGASIHVWNGHDWDHVDGAAVKIAVGPDGQPWIVNSAGNIFRRSGEGWELLPGLAREIAIGADGSVFCISIGQMPSGGHSIHVWNGFDWDHVPGAAVKIAAGAPGAVWLVNSEHQIFHGV